MLNEAHLIGHAGADPEIRSMANGDKVASFSLATSERWKDKATGEKRETTEWHRVVAFGPVVSVIESYVKKGSKLHLIGAIRTRKWQDKDGADRWSTEIVLSGLRAKLTLLDSQGAGGGVRDYASHAESGPPAAGTGHNFADDLDDDVPF